MGGFEPYCYSSVKVLIFVFVKLRFCFLYYSIYVCTQKGPELDLNPTPFSCEAKVTQTAIQIKQTKQTKNPLLYLKYLK